MESCTRIRSGEVLLELHTSLRRDTVSDPVTTCLVGPFDRRTWEGQGAMSSVSFSDELDARLALALDPFEDMCGPKSQNSVPSWKVT